MSLLSEQKTYYSNGQLKSHLYYRKYESVNLNTNNHLQHYQYYSFYQEGESKKWYENGQLSWHIFYQNGELNGESKAWYENGQLEWHEFRRNDKMEGESKRWHDDGRLQRHEYYINGIQFDKTFSVWKKYRLLKLKRNIMRKVYKRKYEAILNEKLLLDLNNIIIRYL